MANWPGLRRHIFDNYKVAKDRESFLQLLFGFEDGRSQLVYVSHHKTTAGEDWVILESAIGPLDRLNVLSVLESVSDIICGGLGRVENVLTLRDAFPLENLDVNEFERPLAMITTTADYLEQKHVGADTF